MSMKERVSTYYRFIQDMYDLFSASKLVQGLLGLSQHS